MKELIIIILISPLLAMQIAVAWDHIKRDRT
jgi:hypothetical protein